jgi:type IV pilus assembly protein PilC
MAEFSYTAINASGSEVRGNVDAKNIKTARANLTSQNLTVTAIKKESELTWEEYFAGGNKKIGQKDLLMFTKYFAVLTRAGIPILKALVILENQVDNLKLRKRIKKIREGIEAGSNLHEQFSRYPDTFPPMYLNLVKIGEESGMLFEMLEKLGVY